ncbi:MAG: D-tyrosyl-tRNA(Tyr) deacylase [Trueperaceae bacterium]|nr:D-tyrosyl-tRNA(Tyr) deacylase [Trueperaceae bacterium]MCO5174149.1 D-aminoacyl-tRNA deacylase [Trueperaceae bacterium]MCW5820498.1 D-tyrosyl-tRNA(Tyr) deacylase [Trueperaceae bacterium]
MRALVQRVSRARVTVAERLVGEVGHGFLVLLGVTHSDDAEVTKRLAEKVRKLRVFEDEAGKMNLDLAAAGGACLVISQFTLYGDARNGNRPGFGTAARPEVAEPLYLEFVAALRKAGVTVATGEFGAMMAVELVNSGPTTIWLDSDELFPAKA